MGWGRGGRGRSGWGRGKGDRGEDGAAEEKKAHYFEANSASSSPEDSAGPRLEQVKKTLQEIDLLEKHMQKGEGLSKSQMSKLNMKVQLEQELDNLTCHQDAEEEAMIAELMKEKETLELELAGVEVSGAKEEASWTILPGAVAPKEPAKGKASPAGQLQLPGTKSKKLAPWSRGSSRAASPAASPAADSGELATATTPRSPRNQLRLPIPGHTNDSQRALLEGDLPYWAQKFASSARMEEDFIVVELGDEALGSNAAKQELFELIEYDLELPTGALNSCNVSVKSPSKKSKQQKFVQQSLSDPSTVFACCDTSGTGSLDLHELKFALNAFGLFPTMEYLSSWMENRSTLTLGEFQHLLDSKHRSAPSSMRAPRAVPYAWRGVCMRQVDDLHKTFIGSGWLQQQCANFNTEHEQQIRGGKMFAMETNLYALNRWVIMPGTSPSPKLPIPEEMQRSAGMPTAGHECSFSELMNPDKEMNEMLTELAGLMNLQLAPDKSQGA